MDETLLKTHAWLVKRIAHHLLVRLPRTVQLDDLMQTGMMGLLDAAKHYDASKGASFETYASIRIKGCMLDDIRAHDWVPRSVHQNARLISEAVRKLENQLGREAKDVEIAEELGLSLDAYFNLLNDTAGVQLYGFSDCEGLEFSTRDIAEEPDNQVLLMDRKKRLTEIIESLPRQEALVLSLYYQHDLNLKEIAEVLTVTESRVSQIHTKAMLRIRARLPEEI